MQKTREIYVRCQITRSVFSGERIFRVVTAGWRRGRIHAGAPQFITSSRLMATNSKRRIPPQGQNVADGWISASLSREWRRRTTVVFPGGEMAKVKTNQIRQDLPEGGLECTCLIEISTGRLRRGR